MLWFRITCGNQPAVTRYDITQYYTNCRNITDNKITLSNEQERPPTWGIKLNIILIIILENHRKTYLLIQLHFYILGISAA